MSNMSPWCRRACATILCAVLGTSLSGCITVSGGSGGTVTVKTEEDGDRPRAPRPPKPSGVKTSLETLTRTGVTIAVVSRLFSFEAPVKGREPLVIDFELARKGTLRLDILVEGAKRPTTLMFDGKANTRKLDKRKKLPARLGDWQAAELSLSAFDKSKREIDFRVFGIGIGKRAVGSTGIYDVTLEPFVIRATESASWSFWSRHDFERSRLVLYRRERAGSEQQEILTSVLESPCQPRRQESCTGDWDLRDEEGERFPGRYRLAVKAWQEATLDKDWIIEWSEDEVTVQ